VKIIFAGTAHELANAIQSKSVKDVVDYFGFRHIDVELDMIEITATEDEAGGDRYGIQANNTLCSAGVERGYTQGAYGATRRGEAQARVAE